jgi:alpha-L-fucosidase
MKLLLPPVSLVLSALIALTACRESRPRTNYISFRPGEDPEKILEKATRIAPSERQLAWQDLEYTVFVHFGMNTFTNREWGEGTEDPAWFNPTGLDARQWAETAKDAGMKMILMVAKHLDGFCLWPSDYTDHSVKNSPWREGKGDLVKEVSEACRETGLKFGVYLSPWDRHEQSYGTDQYNDHFVNQLTELLTNYGVVDEVWFDGANGEGPNGKRQVYDWLRYYTTIRKLQPQAVIAIMGPDVRWVGTESGYGRATEWSVVPYALADQDKIAANSQQAPTDGVFIPAGDMMQQDLGSRSKIIQAPALIWYPSEVDVSIRPGWFYHPAEDDRVKTPEKLLDIWFSSVGQNSLLLLNLPADKRGLIHENDVAALKGFREVRAAIFSENMAAGAQVSASSTAPGSKAGHVLVPGREKYWMAKKGETNAWIEFELPAEKTFDCLQIQENIEFGQRVEQFSLEIWRDKHWREVTRATTIGYKRLIRFSPVTASRVRVRIIQARNTPSISFIALHKRLPSLEIKPSSGAFLDSVKVVIETGQESARIFYTTDGTRPDDKSIQYTGPFVLMESTLIKAVAIDDRGISGFVREGNFVKADFTIRYADPPSTKYPPKNQIILLDGRLADPDYSNGEWLGWEGKDMTALIDLGESRSFNGLGADFLNSTGSWIFLPTRVDFEYSSDGRNWQLAGTSVNEVKWNDFNEVRNDFKVQKNFTARYIRVKAVGQKTCPPGHGGAGNPCWLFCDEISFL